MQFFPRQDIPENEKNEAWCGQCLDYAIRNFDSMKTRRIDKINRLYASYNGIIPANSIEYLTKTYGKSNRGKFMPFRIAKPKIDLMIGEFLTRPIPYTLMTINPEAKAEKLENYHIMIGMMNAKEEVEKLRDVVGVDVTEGMDIPDKNNPDALEMMNVKSQHEHYMQLALNYHIKFEKLRDKFSSNFLDVTIASECYGRVEIGESDRETHYREIDPRNALFEELDRDPFLLRSPYKGEARKMFVHEILAEFAVELTQEQRNKLDDLKTRSGDYLSGSFGNRSYYSLIDNNLSIDVFIIEWKSSRPFYTKIVNDPSNPDIPHKKNIAPEEYESNKAQYDRDVANGKYIIEKKYLVDMWEAVQIGHEMKLRCRRKPFQVRSMSNPSETEYGYHGLIFNTRDGMRVSMWEFAEKLSFLYDTVMFQINRELAKLKGKVVMYDRSFLPKGMTMKDVLFDIANDGILSINTAQDGSRGGRELNVQGGINEVDLGISASMQYLLGLKIDIQNTLDKLTGINENREGQIAASSTATNAQSSIQASRTITEPMYYFMNRFMENVFDSICAHTKITWGLLESKKAANIIGDTGVGFFKATKDLMNCDFATFISDGGNELKVRELINRLSEVSLNTKELRLHDVLDVNLAETIAEASAKLKKGWQEVQVMNQKTAQINAQAQQEQMQRQIQMALEDREDKQAHDMDMIAAKAHIDFTKQTQVAQNEMQKEKIKADLDSPDTKKAQQMMGTRR